MKIVEENSEKVILEMTLDEAQKLANDVKRLEKLFGATASDLLELLPTPKDAGPKTPRYEWSGPDH
ncbi:MAG: hypothetical protein JJ693_01490 [Acidithiobacillus sp.]|nr:hypothetical protein [Acidithiobacillus sp.]